MPAYLQTYIDLGKTQVLRLQSLFYAGILKDPPPLIFEVIEGDQGGCTACVDRREFTVGSEFEDDLLVLEGSGSFQASVEQTILGTSLRLKTERSDVKINGKSVDCEAGPQILPCRIAIGDTVLWVEPQSAESNVDSGRDDYKRFVVLSLVMLALVFAVFGYLNRTQSVAIVAAGSDRATTEVSSLNIAFQRASAVIDESGLSRSLSVQRVDDKTFKIVGQVYERDEDDWHRLRQQVDEILAGGTILNAVRLSPSISNSPAISLLIIGDNPVVVLSDGRRLLRGDDLVPGWTIDEVTSKSIDVVRGDERVTISL